MATIHGTSGQDTLNGADEADTIYGYDPAIGGDGLSIQATRIVSGLAQPTYVTSPPNDPSRLYILEKEGLIKVMNRETGEVSSTPVLDLRGQIDTDGEQGLAGLAFHPQFGQDGYNKVYVTLSNLDGKTELREYSLTNGVLDPASMRLVLRINEYTEQSALHRAGWIGFGPDGYLYMTTGEGNQFAVAQDPNSLLGKVLRLDVNGTDAYPEDDDKNFAIPDTNPTTFDGVTGTFAPSEVYAIGFRNPWRASIDSDGRMFIGDVGENEYEEINLLRAGANYGWGHNNSNDDGPENPAGPYTNPINYYYHGDDPGIPNDGLGASVTGGYVYRGPIEALNGHYIFGDFTSGKILSLHQDENNNWVRTDLTSLITGDASGSLGFISSFGQDAQGNIYVVAYRDVGSTTGSIYRLTPQILDLGDTLSGHGGNDTIYGGGGNDSIDGGADNDRLYGDAGADTLRGGTGDDNYYVDRSDTIIEATNGGYDRVFALESFILQTKQSIELLSTADQNSTAALNLTGNVFSQDLVGNAGANRLDGGGGEDTLRGLRGNDTYVVDADDTIIESEDGGIDTVETSQNNYILGAHLENLTLRETAVKGTGNALNNVLTGNYAGNILSGAGGADTLAGGLGNDTYIVNTTRDTVIEASGQGTDRIVSSVSYTLGGGTSVEILEAAGRSSLNLTGNTLSNTLVGNSGANRLYGVSGNDKLKANSGHDRLDGGSGSDTLEGGSGNDRLDAGSGNDRLLGGSGTDTLTGGAGRDRFVFDDKETGSSKSKADYIADFSGRGGDKIDLRAIDANTKKSGDQNFAFIGKKGFSKAGELRYEKTKGYTYVYLNTDSDKAAEAVIKLKGSLEMSKGWFVL